MYPDEVEEEVKEEKKDDKDSNEANDRGVSINNDNDLSKVNYSTNDISAPFELKQELSAQAIADLSENR